jgi:hypothetical protein
LRVVFCLHRLRSFGRLVVTSRALDACFSAESSFVSFSSDEHPSTPYNRRARFTRTHQPHRTPRALVLVMADDLSNLGACAFDPRGSRRGGFPTPNVIAHALFLSPRGAVQRRPDGSRPRRPGDARDARTPLANATRSVTYTGFWEYRLNRAVRRSRARGRQDTGAGALFCWGRGTIDLGGDRPSLGGDVLRPFRRWHRPPTDRGMPRSTRERSMSSFPRRSRPRVGVDPPARPRPPPSPSPNVFPPEADTR